MFDFEILGYSLMAFALRFRYSAGVIPVFLWNLTVKQLMLGKPQSVQIVWISVRVCILLVSNGLR